MSKLTESLAWKKLTEHYKEASTWDMSTMFAREANRNKQFSVAACGIFLDYSKNIISKKTMQLLHELAEYAGLDKEKQAMSSGEKINKTDLTVVLEYPFLVKNNNKS